MNDPHFEKLNLLSKNIETGIGSSELLTKLGAHTVQSSLVEFTVYQTFRAVTQFYAEWHRIAKTGKVFSAPSDEFLYQKRVQATTLLRDLRKCVPIKDFVVAGSDFGINELNPLLTKYLDDTDEFLKKRNDIIHHLPKSTRTIEDTVADIQQADSAYQEIMKNQTFIPKIAVITQMLQFLP